MFSINQRFEFLENLTQMVTSGVTPSLIIVGEGGLGKTHSVNKTIENVDMSESDYVFFKGYSTARGLYNTLYDNNGKLIVFDDCDSVLEDKVAINILKSALDSYDSRKISWMAKMNKTDDYPSQFEFTGRIIFISNKSVDKIDGAILSRSIVVDLTMTPDEKIDRMSHIINHILPQYPIEVKNEALDFLNENKCESNLNLRTLIMVSKIRYSFPETWTNLAKFMINSRS
jgi:hypothetical protein